MQSKKEEELIDSPGRTVSINPPINQDSNDMESPVMPKPQRAIGGNMSTTQLPENRRVLVNSSQTDSHMRPVSMPLIPNGSPVGSLRMDVPPRQDPSRSEINHGTSHNNQVNESVPKSPSAGPSERDLSRKNSRSVIGSTKGKADEYSRKNVNRMRMHLEETVRTNRIYRGSSAMDFDDSKSVKSQILNEDKMKKRLQEQFPKGDAFLDNDSVRSWDLNDEQAKLTQIKKENHVVDASAVLRKQMTKRASDGEMETAKLTLDNNLLRLQHVRHERVQSGPVHGKVLLLVLGIFLLEALRTFVNSPVRSL